jgi:hypothetical protein
MGRRCPALVAVGCLVLFSASSDLCLPDHFLRAYGLPHLLKFVHSPSLLVVLNEMNAGYRQVFTGCRKIRTSSFTIPSASMPFARPSISDALGAVSTIQIAAKRLPVRIKRRHAAFF